MKIVPELMFMQMVETKFQFDQQFDTDRLMKIINEIDNREDIDIEKIINENDISYKPTRFINGYRLCVNGLITLQ